MIGSPSCDRAYTLIRLSSRLGQRSLGSLHADNGHAKRQTFEIAAIGGRNVGGAGAFWLLVEQNVSSRGVYGDSDLRLKVMVDSSLAPTTAMRHLASSCSFN